MSSYEIKNTPRAKLLVPPQRAWAILELAFVDCSPGKAYLVRRRRKKSGAPLFCKLRSCKVKPNRQFRAALSYTCLVSQAQSSSVIPGTCTLVELPSQSFGHVNFRLIRTVPFSPTPQNVCVFFVWTCEPPLEPLASSACAERVEDWPVCTKAPACRSVGRLAPHAPPQQRRGRLRQTQRDSVGPCWTSGGQKKKKT